jgi:hypothetical protein
VGGWSCPTRAASAARAHGPVAATAAPATGVPSWPAPAADKVAAAVRAAGLPLLTMEGTDLHFHAHLDVIVNGQAVAVPAGIGIEGTTGVSSMHTHDLGGVIHIESPTQGTFTLGQFFAEWQVPLTGSGERVRGPAVRLGWQNLAGLPQRPALHR